MNVYIDWILLKSKQKKLTKYITELTRKWKRLSFRNCKNIKRKTQDFILATTYNSKHISTIRDDHSKYKDIKGDEKKCFK